MFVVDGVVHVADLSFDHMKVRPSIEEIEEILDRNVRLLGGVLAKNQRMGDDVSDEARGKPDANYQVIFGSGATDMALVGSLPFQNDRRVNRYVDPNHPMMVNHGLVAAFPERCIFIGGIEPFGQMPA